MEKLETATKEQLNNWFWGYIRTKQPDKARIVSNKIKERFPEQNWSLLSSTQEPKISAPQGGLPDHVEQKIATQQPLTDYEADLVVASVAA